MATLVTYALTTVDDVKESLGIDSSDHSKDNLIIRKINQATDMIENFTGRRFALTTYENEEYDSTNTNQLILKNYPVTELTGFGNRDGYENTDDWDTVDADFYFLDAKAGVLDLNFGTGRGWNMYRVSYKAGYATIPADLSEAAAEVAVYLVNKTLSGIIAGQTSSGSGGAIKSKSEGGRKIEYYDTADSSGTSNSASGSVFSIFNKLGLLDTLNSYSKLPILADK